MNPYQARQPKDEMDFYFNTWANAKHDRIYKPLFCGRQF